MADVFESINPATGQREATFSPLTGDQLRSRLDASRQVRPDWAERSLQDRSVGLTPLAKLIREQKAELAALATREMGKPLSQALAEVEKCAILCEYYLEHGPRFLAPERGTDNPAKSSWIRFDPLGGVLAVMPWNFPFWQVFRFVVPTLLSGNVGLLKHASNVSGCALAIEDLIRKAGFPEGAFYTLLIDRDELPAVVGDPAVQAVTLTGSEGAGRALGEVAGRHLKKCVLELGGSDPFLVLPDADLARTAEQAVRARTQNNGQSCIAAKRFLLHEEIADEFTEAFVARMKQLRMGDPMDPSTQLGPLAREDLRDGLHRQVQKSVAQGAKLLAGGQSPDRPGWYYEATVLAEVTPSMTGFCEETFGPVATLTRCPTVDAMIKLANDSLYGLGASIWTGDRERAHRIAAQLDAGTVFINEIVQSHPSLPFGGVKNSGYGRELGEFGIREFVNIKTVWEGA